MLQRQRFPSIKKSKSATFTLSTILKQAEIEELGSYLSMASVEIYPSSSYSSLSLTIHLYNLFTLRGIIKCK